MRRSTVRLRLTALVAPLLVAALAAPVAAQSLGDVVEKRQQLEADLDAVTLRIEELDSLVFTIQDELDTLDLRRAELLAEAQDADADLALRVRATFKRGSVSTLSAFISGHGPAEAVERAALLDAVNGRDIGRLQGAESLRTQLDQIEALRSTRMDALTGAQDELDGLAAQLMTRLGNVRSQESELRTRAARQRAISRGQQKGTYACIMSRNSFTDSWGFARSGGRRHKGTDVMAPYGEPVYAFPNGRVERTQSGGLGGVVLYLRGDDGHRYYYAHLKGYASGIGTGTRVEAGQLIAYNGDTGNAKGGAPHVHYEVHPNGGGAVNPYPWLVAACR